MRAVVKEWGHSAAIRLPAKVLDAAAQALDQAVELREEDGRIIIEPIRPAPLTFDALLDGVTADNTPEVVDFGPPLGRETW